MDFEHIILEQEQQELFIKIVECFKKVPRENRGLMIEANSKSGNCLIMPDSSNIGGFAIEDPHILANEGLLNLGYGSRGGKNYTVTPMGYLYYEWLMKGQGKPVERIATNIRKYLDLDEFKNQYNTAFQKIKIAEENLWRSDQQKEYTVIGHLCREAMMEFADSLYNSIFQAPSTKPKSKTIDRIREVINAKQTKMGTTVQPFLDSLLNYWGTLNDLVQRQEHGAEKEGEELVWEDARRVVFQSINVMYELHRTLGKSAN